MKKVLVGSFLLLSLLSCQEEVFMELGDAEKIPVIEAIWTDRPGQNWVSVSYSREFYDTLDNEVVTDAEVFVTDPESGMRVDFRFVESLGYYLPLNNETAQIGHNYLLEVRIGEQVYQATGQVLQPPVLDSLTYAFYEEDIFRDEGYYLKVYGKIPFRDNNFYRVRITKNDTLLNRRQDYLLFDDSFGTSILDNGFELMGFPFKKDDRIKLELFRLNKEPFDYLNQLVNLLYNDGGLFSPPPQNPQSNIKVIQGDGRVAGYFVSAPVLTESIMIVVE